MGSKNNYCRNNRGSAADFTGEPGQPGKKPNNFNDLARNYSTQGTRTVTPSLRVRAKLPADSVDVNGRAVINIPYPLIESLSCIHE